MCAWTVRSLDWPDRKSVQTDALQDLLHLLVNTGQERQASQLLDRSEPLASVFIYCLSDCDAHPEAFHSIFGRARNALVDPGSESAAVTASLIDLLSRFTLDSATVSMDCWRAIQQKSSNQAK